MARRRKTLKKDSAVSEEATEGQASSDSFTVVVPTFILAGVKYHSGDPIVIESPHTVEKLKARGIIS